MFPIHINDGTTELPKDDIYFIIAKEGIFLKKKMGIMESLAPVDNISILQSVAMSAQMHIPKIPGQSFAKVIEFFKKVYTEYRSEAIVLLFYNEELQKFKVMTPKQEVSGASVDYNRSISIDKYTMIGDIHSHAGFSAFHSGTDDSDEETFDGLHITVGNVDDDDVSISASIVANGHRFMVNPEDYISSIQLTKDIDEKATGYKSKTFKWKDNKLILDTEASNTYTYRKMDKRYISTISPSKRVFNDEWFDNVTHKQASYVYGGGYGVITGQYYKNGKWQTFKNKNWSSHYDPHAWQQYHKIGSKPPAQAKIPDKSEEVITVDIDEYTCPCQTCRFREEKLQIENEDELIEIYQCGQCGEIVIDNTDEDVECKKCGTDQFLVFIEPEELENHYELSPLIECQVCGNTFIKSKNQLLCPYCYELLSEDQVEYNKEEELISQSKKDSGEYLDSEIEEANREALNQLQDIEKIPDPEKNEIPITQKHKDDNILKKMFKGVFGGN